MTTTEILQGDCIELMRDMADNSVDAVVTDPPYFRVKGEAWDRQWSKPEQFLEWLDAVAVEWWRVLKPNGSLYCFASPQMAARVEVKIGARFNVLNSLVWSKSGSGTSNGMGRHAQACKENLRSYFPNTERIIFAEHFGSDNVAKGEAGYIAKCDELRGFLFEPLRAYLAGEWDRAGLTPENANEACGHRLAGGMAGRHYFSQSQWALPTRKNYEKLREYANRSGGDYLSRDYDELTSEYESIKLEYDDLKQEYENLRRPFSVTADVPYTDVWSFPTVQHYPGKHPCEKPQELLRHIIRSSTREGDTVLDTFAGTGSTGLACQELGRNFIGCELDPTYCNTARDRIQGVLMATA